MERKSFCALGAFLLTLELSAGCAKAPDKVGGGPTRAVAEAPAEDGTQPIDRRLLEKVQALYPRVRAAPSGTEAYFTEVRECLRVRVDDATERQFIEVRWAVPAARVLHGAGELLVFRDREDRTPIARVRNRVLEDRPIDVIEDRWARFGRGPLVSLLDEDSLRKVNHAAGGYLNALMRVAARAALRVYVEEGLERFLSLVPVREKREERVTAALPARVEGVELYPARVEDFRSGVFRYSSAWEGTLLVRTIPSEPGESPVVFEIGAYGRGEGIEAGDVQLFVWRGLSTEPSDRPAPDEEMTRLHAGRFGRVPDAPRSW